MANSNAGVRADPAQRSTDGQFVPGQAGHQMDMSYRGVRCCMAWSTRSIPHPYFVPTGPFHFELQSFSVWPGL